MDFQTVAAAAKHVWTERLGMAPLWTPVPRTLAASASNGQPETQKPSPTQSPDASPLPFLPVEDVSDRYVDTTPKTVPQPLGVIPNHEGMTSAQLGEALDRLPAAPVYCAGCEEHHEAPACTTVPQRMAAMRANEHPAQYTGAVHVNVADQLIEQARGADIQRLL